VAMQRLGQVRQFMCAMISFEPSLSLMLVPSMNATGRRVEHCFSLSAADGSCHRHGEHATAGQDDADAYAKFPPDLKDHFSSILGAAVHFICHAAAHSVAAHNSERLQTSLSADTLVDVVIHNDDVHTYDEVIGAFRQIGGHGQSAAFQLTQAVDDAGHSVLLQRTMQGLTIPTASGVSTLQALRASGLLYSLETAEVSSVLNDAHAVCEWLRAVSQSSRAARLITIDALTGMDVSLLMQAARARDVPAPSASPAISSWTGASSANGGQQAQPIHATPMQLLLHCGPWQRQGTVEALHALFTDAIRESCFRDGFGWALLTEYPSLSRLFAQGVGTSEHTVLDYAVQILTVPSFVRRCVPLAVAEAILSDQPMGGELANEGPLVPLARSLGDALAHACNLSLPKLYESSGFLRANQARETATIGAAELGPAGAPHRFEADISGRALDSQDRVLVYNRYQVTGRILDYVSRIPGVAAVTLAQPGMWRAVLRAAAAVSDSGPHWHKKGDHVGHDGQNWVQEFNASISTSSLLNGVLFDAVVPAAHAYGERLDVARGVTPSPPRPATVDAMLSQGAWGTAGLSLQQWQGAFRGVLDAHAKRRAALLPPAPASAALVPGDPAAHRACAIALLAHGQPPFSMPVDIDCGMRGSMPLTAHNSASSFHGLLPRLAGMLSTALSTRLPAMLPRSPFTASLKVQESGDADQVAAALGAVVLDVPGIVAEAAGEVAAALSADEHKVPGVAVLNLLMDGPLNTLALAGAVRAGLWKRNGHSMETELMNYAEPPLCGNMQDADLHTVSLAMAAKVAAVESSDLSATQCSLDSSIARLLKAFDVWSTLLHPAARLATAVPGVFLPRPNVYLLEAALARAEEALRVLVQLTTELPFRAAPAVSQRAPINVDAFAEASTRHSVAREVVHFLMRGPAARSAVAKALSMYKTRGAGRVDDDLLTDALRDVADFREGTGMDAGKYALKKEVMQGMYDPCFLHLSPESHTLAKDAWREGREGSLDSKFAKVPFATSAIKSKYIKAAMSAARPMVACPAIPAPGFIRALAMLFSPALLRVVQVALHAAVTASAQSSAILALRKAVQPASGWTDKDLPHSDASKVLSSQGLLQLCLQLLTNALHVAELWRQGHAGLHAAAAAHMPQFGPMVQWWLEAIARPESPSCVHTTVPDMGLPLPPDGVFGRPATAVAVFAEASGQLLGEYSQRPSNAQMVAWVLHAGTSEAPTTLNSVGWDPQFFACFTSSPALLKAASEAETETVTEPESDEEVTVAQDTATAAKAAYEHVTGCMDSVVSNLALLWRGDVSDSAASGSGAAAGLAEPSPLVRESAAWCLSALQLHEPIAAAVQAASGLAAALQAEAAAAASAEADGESTPGDKKAKSAKKAKKGKKGKDAQLKAMQRLKSQQASFLGELSGDESDASAEGGTGLGSALLPTLAEPSAALQAALHSAGVVGWNDEQQAAVEFYADSVPRGALDNTSAAVAHDDEELARELHSTCLAPMEDSSSTDAAAVRPLVSLALAVQWRRKRVQRLGHVGALAALMAEDEDLSALPAAAAVPAGHNALPRLAEVEQALGKPDQVLAACGLAPDGSVLPTVEHGAVCILCRDTQVEDPLLFLSLVTPPGLYFPSLLRSGCGLQQDVASAVRALLGPDTPELQQLVPPSGTHYAVTRGLAMAARGDDVQGTWLELLQSSQGADAPKLGDAPLMWLQTAKEWLAAKQLALADLLPAEQQQHAEQLLASAAAKRSMLLGTVLPGDSSSQHMRLLCTGRARTPSARPSAAVPPQAETVDDLDAALAETLEATTGQDAAAAVDGKSDDSQGESVDEDSKSAELDGDSDSEDDEDSGGVPGGPPDGVSMAVWSAVQQIIGSGNAQLLAMLQGMPTAMVAQMLASSGALPAGVSVTELTLRLETALAQATAGNGDAADNVHAGEDSDDEDEASGLEMNISQADRRARASKAVRNALTADRLVAFSSLAARGALSARAGAAGGASGTMRASFTGTCMHSGCAQKFLEKGHDSNFARTQAANILQTEAGEFQCPLSQDLCNSMLPRSFGASNSATVCPPDSWWPVEVMCDNEAIRAVLSWEQNVFMPALAAAAAAVSPSASTSQAQAGQLHTALAACDQPFALLSVPDFRSATAAVACSLVAALGKETAAEVVAGMSLASFAHGSTRLPRHVRLLDALQTAMHAAKHAPAADLSAHYAAQLPPADVLAEVETTVLCHSFTVATQGSRASLAQASLRINATERQAQLLAEAAGSTWEALKATPAPDMSQELKSAVAEKHAKDEWVALMRAADEQAVHELNSARGFVVACVDALENVEMTQARRKRHWQAALLLAQEAGLTDQAPADAVVVPAGTASTGSDARDEVAGLKRPRQDSAQGNPPARTPVIIQSCSGMYMGLVPPQTMGAPSTPREDAPMYIRAPLHQLSRLTSVLRVLAVAVADSLVFTTALPAPFSMLKEVYEAEAAAAAASDLWALLSASGPTAPLPGTPAQLQLAGSKSSTASVSVATTLQNGTFAQAGDVPLSPQPAASVAGRTQSAWASLLSTARRLVTMGCRNDSAVLVAPLSALLQGTPAVRVGPALQAWAGFLSSCGLSMSDMQLTTQGPPIHPWLVGVPSAYKAASTGGEHQPRGMAAALLVLPLELIKFLMPHACDDEGYWSYDEGCTLRGEGPLAAGMPVRLADMNPCRVLLLVAAVSTRWEDVRCAAAQLMVSCAVQAALSLRDAAGGASSCNCSTLEFYQFASAFLRAAAPVDVRADAAAAVLRGTADVIERALCPQLLAVHEVLHGAVHDSDHYVQVWAATYLDASLRDVWVGSPAPPHQPLQTPPRLLQWRGAATPQRLKALLHCTALYAERDDVALDAVLLRSQADSDFLTSVAPAHLVPLLQLAVSQQPAASLLSSARQATPASPMAASGAGDIVTSGTAPLPLYRCLPLFVASLVPLPTKFSTLAKHVARGYSSLLPKRAAGLRASSGLTQVQRVFGLSGAAVSSETHLSYEEPAVDLVTGTIVPAAQQTRSPADGRGLVARFTEAMHGGVGVFLLARTSAILIVRKDFMAYFPSPYVDKHGEPDVGLRRGLPLVLSLERYAKLCKAWASGELATLVTRARTNADRVIRVAWY